MENSETEQTGHEENRILPKPILVEDKKNWVRRSLISLAIYGVLFLFVFQVEPIYIAALLIVLLIHEFGHFFAMKAFNYTNVKLFVLPLLGAYVTGKKSAISQRQMSLVILAGPVPGIIIGMLLLISTDHYPNERIEMLGYIFLGLNFFNLLPFMPLDGGRLLETLFINQNHVIRIVFSIISLIFIAAFALYSQSIILLFLPLLMVLDLVMEIKNQKIRNYLKQENINYTVSYEDLPDKDYWTIRDCLILSFSKRYNGIQAGVHQYSIIEGGIIKHVVAVLKTPVIKDLKAFGKIIVLFILMTFLVLPVVYYVPKAIAEIHAAQITP